jgi:hypothetical protein
MAVKIQMLVPCHSTQDYCLSMTENCLDKYSVNISPQRLMPQQHHTKWCLNEKLLNSFHMILL